MLETGQAWPSARARASELDGAAIIEHVKESLAGYEAPKHVVQVPEVYRLPAGKADFQRTRQMAMEQLRIAG